MNRKNIKKNKWQDHYTQQAKKDQFPARSVYKLKEIQQKYRLIRKRDKVIDLGCSPGAWLLYTADLVGSQGQIVGVDLKPVTIKIPAHVNCITADILSVQDPLSFSIGKDYNAVLSDMAPATTGNKTVDTARSFVLCEAALGIAMALLAPGGSFVCKIFQGPDFKSFSDTVRAGFKQHKIFKPQACRKASKEIYIIGMGKK
jgi:23S rRNA (uridine2552-2'-O)-methyltransferase